MQSMNVTSTRRGDSGSGLLRPGLWRSGLWRSGLLRPGLWPMGWTLGLLSLSVGCSGSGEDPTPSPTPEVTPTPFANEIPVTLQFEAVVGADAFACGETYAGVGASASTFEPADLRLYVSEVRLINEAGEEVPVSLDQDGLWQVDTVGLLDFEDATGRCSNGTAPINTVLKGVTAGGVYTGIHFVLGVPFELNHNDASTAPSPLNVTSMFWSWNSGYKFLKLDGFSTGQSNGLAVHVGSTECDKNSSGTITGCDHPNRADVTLTGFDPLSTPLLVDVAGLFEGVDIDANTSGSAALCMSAANDPECGDLFANLGLPFGRDPGDPSAQRFFRVE